MAIRESYLAGTYHFTAFIVCRWPPQKERLPKKGQEAQRGKQEQSAVDPAG